MAGIRKVLAICGSTRSRSTNLNFIEAVANLSKGVFQIELFSGLADLPHFNPDLDTNTPPATVANFRKSLTDSEGVLICTPEYAMGPPGTLKNALDWAVSSCEFNRKPVALITAATSGQKAHESLMATLQMIDAVIGEKAQLLISFAKAKINHKAEIVDAATLHAIEDLITAFSETIDNRRQEALPVLV